MCEDEDWLNSYFGPEVMNDLKKEYLKICESDPSIPLHGQSWWLDTVCGVDNWQVEGARSENGELDFALPFQVQKLQGLPAILQPVLSQYSFLWKNPKTDYPSVDQLLQALPKVPVIELNFSPGIKLGNTAEKHRHSYIVGAPSQVETLQYNQNLRRNLKKATKSYQITERNDPEAFYQINQSSFLRQNLPMPYNKALLRAVTDALHVQGSGAIFFAEELKPPHEIIGGILIAWDKGSYYYIAGGQKSKKGKPSSHALLMDHAIMKARDSGKDFDFCGSEIPGVARFFSSFGGERVEFVEFQKYRGLGKLRPLKKALL